MSPVAFAARGDFSPSDSLPRERRDCKQRLVFIEKNMLINEANLFFWPLRDCIIYIKFQLLSRARSFNPSSPRMFRSLRADPNWTSSTTFWPKINKQFIFIRPKRETNELMTCREASSFMRLSFLLCSLLLRFVRRRDLLLIHQRQTLI